MLHTASYHYCLLSKFIFFNMTCNWHMNMCYLIRLHVDRLTLFKRLLIKNQMLHIIIWIFVISCIFILDIISSFEFFKDLNVWQWAHDMIIFISYTISLLLFSIWCCLTWKSSLWLMLNIYCPCSLYWGWRHLDDSYLVSSSLKCLKRK
jgi:hypothetical protein